MARSSEGTQRFELSFVLLLGSSLVRLFRDFQIVSNNLKRSFLFGTPHGSKAPEWVLHAICLCCISSSNIKRKNSFIAAPLSL